MPVAGRLTEKKLELEIARLRGLELPNLRAIWEKHHGTAAPKTLRRDTLIRSILWQMQAKAFGGLKPATRKYLLEIADAARSKTAANCPPPPPIRIRPGTKLIRVWQDRTHTVTALNEGFEWQGKRYRSLSQIARAMTGTRWNGLVFFGVKRKSASQAPSWQKTEAANDSERVDA
jgi:hypothetical protein